MPDAKEVYEMVTKQKPPEPGALERQQKRQVRAARNKKFGAFAVAAAIGVVAIAVILANRPGENATIPANEPTVNPAEAEAEAVGTVTFDGLTCSMEITADRIEPGIVLFELVNASEQRAMFDSYQLLEGYTVRSFAAIIERDRRRAEPWIFPDQEVDLPRPGDEVRYLRSDLIPANSSEIIVTTMSPGKHAIVCMQPYEDPLPDFPLRPFGVVGPIVIR